MIPQRCFHFRFSNSTFPFPTDSPFYSWHCLAFLCGSATSRTSLSPVQPRPPAHCCLTSGSDGFSLFANPLSTWMSPKLIPQQAICKFRILALFLMLTNHKSSRRGQVVAPGWSADGFKALWPCSELPGSPQEQLTAPTPRLPAHPNPQKAIISTPSALLPLYSNKGQEDKDIIMIATEKKT